MCRRSSGTASVLTMSGSRLLSTAGHWSTERTSELRCTCSFHATQVEDGPYWPSRHPAGRTNNWHLEVEGIKLHCQHLLYTWSRTTYRNSGYKVDGRINMKQTCDTGAACYPTITVSSLVPLSRAVWVYLYVSKAMWNSLSGSACPTLCRLLDVGQYFMMVNGTEKWFFIWKHKQ